MRAAAMAASMNMDMPEDPPLADHEIAVMLDFLKLDADLAVMFEVMLDPEESNTVDYHGLYGSIGIFTVR